MISSVGSLGLLLYLSLNSIYNYTWNDNLAAILEAKLKAAIDNQEPQNSPTFKGHF